MHSPSAGAVPGLTHEFLLGSISDLQDTIRAADTKSEVLLVVLSLPIMNFSAIDQAATAIFRDYGWMSYVAKPAVALAVLSWVAAFFLFIRVLIARTIRPGVIVNAPGRSSFFPIHHFSYDWRHFICDRPSRTPVNLDVVISELPSNEEQIRRELAFEQIKLGSIASRKLYLVKLGFQFSLLSGATWLLTFFLMRAGAAHW